MHPWLWFWAPQIHFPWSGSLAQNIAPNTSWFSDLIQPGAGNARIEAQAFATASYGKQLGLITDVLLGPGIELVVHAIPRRYAAGIRITRPPQLREETPFKPSFPVPDLDAVRAAAQATGGFLKAADAAWVVRGATVLDGWDPEGNIVQFSQRVA